MLTNDQFKTRLQLGMVVAVILWGVYLAIGAATYNDDYRKAVIILGCTFGFVTLWAAAYKAGSKKVTEKAAGEKSNATGGWNFASSFGFLFAAGVAAAMTAAVFGGWNAPRWAYALMFAMGAAGGVANLVGLSNPLRKPGRWLGLVGLGLLATAFAMGFYLDSSPSVEELDALPIQPAAESGDA